MNVLISVVICSLLVVPFAYLIWRYILFRGKLDSAGELANLRRDLIVEWIAAIAVLLLAFCSTYAFYIRDFHLWLSARPNMLVLQIFVLMTAGMLLIALSFWQKVKYNVANKIAVRWAGVGSILIGCALLLLLLLPHLFLHWGTALDLLGFASLGWAQTLKIRGLRTRMRSIAY